MRKRWTLAELNGMDKAAFVEALNGIYEHSPWVLERAWERGPFFSLKDVAGACAHAIQYSSKEEQLRLLLAHPDLGAKMVMTSDSRGEQDGAGLNRLTPLEYAEFSELNTKYVRRFGFPFILAVKGHSKDTIRIEMRVRLVNSAEAEWERALHEVNRIARFRLEERIFERSEGDEACGSSDGQRGGDGRRI
ncbi:2-oxo-4-hydroxy-4-carboxy-5-ureidoimidazoline decarboxylase [Paenibacillus turpanensis]|uniref:2-oxo-4-hydroxy-4-carboxy-5-ureidoimidazoline decarboxylase n=1 Tax=Paenibacillus turpanensis TaxID=2689078 RepID=UPI00140AC3F8|nr:2-oxo-4-hydroxy-4-carboxy-5-ureidoimidazoline decarboxylase [Paenibacillus turpanensis]